MVALRRRGEGDLPGLGLGLPTLLKRQGNKALWNFRIDEIVDFGALERQGLE
jgi:hypothetical protein